MTDGLEPGERGQLVDPQRLGQRQQLDRRQFARRQRCHPPRDELAQRGADRRTAREPPQAPVAAQRPGLQRAEHELARVERVALAGRDHPFERAALDRTAEAGLDERGDGLVAQPSGARAGCAPASFHSDWIASGTGSPERTVATTNAVEVVARCSTSAAETGSSSCASSTPSTTRRSRGPLAERVPAAAQELERVVGAHVVRDQVGERAERDRRRAAGRLHPDRGQALGRGGGAGLARQPRLAHAGGCAHDDARAAVVPARAGDRSSSASRPISGQDARGGGTCHTVTVTDRDGR